MSERDDEREARFLAARAEWLAKDPDDDPEDPEVVDARLLGHRSGAPTPKFGPPRRVRRVRSGSSDERGQG